MLTLAFRSFLVLAALSIGALSARAQIVFTATGTATSTAGGYTNGQSYTFVYTTGTSFASNADSTFTTHQKSWAENLTTEDQLFTAITGSGLLGTFTRPVATSFDPDSQLFVGNFDVFFKAQVYADSSSNIGLTTPNATPILLVGVSITGGADFFNDDGYVQPVSYFSGPAHNYLGSYPVSPGTGTIIIQGAGFATIESFNVTNLTISTSAIPEPSTSAALLGLGALGLVIWRRRA